MRIHEGTTVSEHDLCHVCGYAVWACYYGPPHENKCVHEMTDPMTCPLAIAMRNNELTLLEKVSDE